MMAISRAGDLNQLQPPAKKNGAPLNEAPFKLSNEIIYFAMTAFNDCMVFPEIILMKYTPSFND